MYIKRDYMFTKKYKYKVSWLRLIIHTYIHIVGLPFALHNPIAAFF